MHPTLRPLALFATCLLLPAAPPALAEVQVGVCAIGINDLGNVAHSACVQGAGPDRTVYLSGTGAVTAPYGVTNGGSGIFRDGPWSSAQAADLASGVLRASLAYSAAPGDPAPYQLGTYLDAYDTLVFSGQGSARFTMRLTGRFTGQPHPQYGNTMDTSLDLTRVGTGYPDVLGRIHLAHVAQDAAAFTAGSTCGAQWYVLGSVTCSVASLDPGQIDITMVVTLDDVRDGDMYWFRSVLNVQAYAPRMGGVDFGNTARIGMELSPGLSLASSGSNVFLAQQAAVVPEPASVWLLSTGLLGLLACGRRRGR